MKIDFYKVLGLIIMLLCVLFVVVLFSGCDTAKQATKHYNKAKDKNIIQVARLVRVDWPCVTTKVDTIKGPDSIIIKEKVVPQYVKIFDTILVDGESMIQTRFKYVDCNCKDSIIYKPQYITKLVEDSAKVMVANADRDKAQKSVDKYKTRAHDKGVVIAVLIGLFVLYLLLTRVFKLF